MITICIEDSPHVLAVLRLLLNRLGHVTECFEDGELAEMRLAQRSDDVGLVLTDHNLPGRTGLQIVATLRAAGYSRRIIVLSSQLTQELSAKYKEYSVEALLEKPISITALQHALQGKT